MTRFARRSLLIAGLAAPLAAAAQTVPAPKEETWEEKWNRMLREDWPGLGRYAEANEALIASGQKVDVVFMGDSITEGWPQKRPGFFTPGRIGRGIGGETTPQMVLRMMADVVHLKPRLVHIMAATNDIAGNTGKITLDQSFDNFRMMVTLAKANGIHVLLASTPPADHFPWRPGLETVAPIRAINAWLKGHAKEAGCTWVDYTPVLATPEGAMKPGLASDGVHPTEAGYDAMASVLGPILAAHKA
ncbi:GDSL-type esterase/lipase family protein [Sphingomonas sp.]|uniref:GDSL-type esterase/lipase family protein n=1 Tax=Sphingomonas sp. TaxID=28214 RepID=UPI001B262C20|nr:GDSL-type esterase/lipase family protein [Sphingomonas sp.]MBO9712247.1 GDSL family lipase [Sphingomonas sp.]